MNKRSQKAWTNWQELVSEHERSGQTAAVFCRERGLCRPYFFAWKKRLRLRQAQSAPVLTKLREKLQGWKEQLLPKHPMAEAVNYVLGQWTELKVFCSDGAVPMDNNVSEREMKRIVLNRKNSLFVGNPRGGRTAAILASLTSTCRRHGIDPQPYLTQLLVNLP
jgi:transposase